MKASAVTDDATATLVASDIAANANLWVAPNVSNLAISAQITQEVPVATINDTSTSDAPQVVVTPTETSTVQEHTVVEGETVDTLA